MTSVKGSAPEPVWLHSTPRSTPRSLACLVAIVVFTAVCSAAAVVLNAVVLTRVDLAATALQRPSSRPASPISQQVAALATLRLEFEAFEAAFDANAPLKDSVEHILSGGMDLPRDAARKLDCESLVTFQTTDCLETEGEGELNQDCENVGDYLVKACGGAAAGTAEHNR